jgi:hypothetical protein
MILESGQVYKIDNKTPKVEKIVFARVNRFDQPIKTWDKMFLKEHSTKGPFIIYDRGWAGKIQLTTKQNVLPHPLHHKKIQ